MPYKDYEKQKANSLRYYYKNKARIRKEAKDYYLKNKEKISKQQKDSYVRMGNTCPKCRKLIGQQANLCSDCFKKGCTKEKNHNWRGGRYKSHGYVMILSPNHPYANGRGYVFEHRLVMENKLGRYLTKEEVVHHLNEIRDDNQIKNLKLFKNNDEHLTYHKLMREEKKHKCPKCNQQMEEGVLYYAYDYEENFFKELGLE